MKRKTTAILALCGVLASTAGAFAIPVAPGVARPDPAVGGFGGAGFSGGAADVGARVTAGDTLLLDARLGHATLASTAPGSKGETFLFASVTGAAGGQSAGRVAAPLDLSIVIDRSGSMKGERIANAIDAAVLAVSRLREGDRVSVVAFDTVADVVVPMTRVSASSRSSIEVAVRGIRLGGDTCISCGLEEGMRQLAPATANAADARVSRMILLSDGATNAGIRDIGGLRAMAGRMRGRGVTISTIGVDVDFDETVMAAIASEASGRHYFVQNASTLASVFSQEFDDLLASVASEADLALELAPGVEVDEVFDRTFRRDGRRVVIPFGTFSEKQEKTVLVKLRVPTDHDGSVPVADVKLAYRDLAKGTDGACSGALTVAVRSDGREQRDLDPFVAARLERSRTAQTLTEANRLFESGKADEARSRLASRRDDLARAKTGALAAATANPFASPPPAAAKPLATDFDDQSAAVARAEASFAKPAPARGATREGKAQVRANQEAASNFGF